MSAAPYPLVLPGEYFPQRMEMADKLFEAHDNKRAGLTLAQALNSRPTAAVARQHGDQSMYYRTGLASHGKGLVGPANCMG